MKKKGTSVDDRKANSQMTTKTSSRTKTKSVKRALSQSARIDEEFEDALLEIDLKRPKKPYNFFIQDMFKKEGGRVDSKTMREFGKKFKSIPEKEKMRYIELADKDRDRYEEHLSLVHQNLIKKPASERKSGYHYFVDENISKALEKGEDLSDTRVKVISKWNSLDDEQKEKYYKMSEQNREVYEKLRTFRNEKISAYLLFSRDKMASAREKGETLTISQCAGLWKKSKESVKEKYEEYAKELKEEIEKNRDMVELTFNMKPNRPLTALNFYTKDCYQQGDVKGFSKSKHVAEKWEKLSEEEREKYIRMAKKERLIYIIKKRNYDAVIRRDIGKAPSSINLFMQDHAGENMAVQALYQLWKTADAPTKKKYQKMALEAKEEFQKKMENYKNRIYEKPKKTLSANNFFVKHKYKDIKNQNPDLSYAEMSKVVSKAYEKLSSSEYKMYEEMANRDLQEKKEYMKQYEANGFYILKDHSKRNYSKKEKEKENIKTKKKSVEEGDEPSSNKKKNKSSSVSKKPKKY